MKKWRGEQSLQLTIASMHPVSSACAKWLFNMPVPNESVCSKVHLYTMHMPLCFNFIAKNMSINSIKIQCFFTTCQSACLKIANGESLFDSNDGDVDALAEYAI